MLRRCDNELADLSCPESVVDNLPHIPTWNTLYRPQEWGTVCFLPLEDKPKSASLSHDEGSVHCIP